MGNTLGGTSSAMGNVGSCSSKGALLLVAAANGDSQVAQEVRERGYASGRAVP